MSNKKRPRRCGSKLLPKGAYRLPDGGVIVPASAKSGRGDIVVRAVRRDQPDMKKLAIAMMDIARQMRGEGRRRQLD